MYSRSERSVPAAAVFLCWIVNGDSHLGAATNSQVTLVGVRIR